MSRRGGDKRKWGAERGCLGDGDRRRSPRLSGSVAAAPSPSHPPHSDSNCNNQPSNNPGALTSTPTRETSSKPHLRLQPSCDSGNKLVPHPSSCAKLQPKQSLKLTRPLHSCEEGDGARTHHDEHSNNDESWLPEKRSLELVLDTLQRRDTYDIFSEPVDPAEVEEYYEIIKEPMDFGTMRAKLHEGMYKSLQQFERDIYLIFGNAMHFNSSATVYFRQARALEDLAKKVLFVLKNDPENFNMDLTATRRRSSRRFEGERFGSFQKIARDMVSNSMRTGLGRKGFIRERTCLTGVDRRSTYKPWICLLDEESSTVSPIFCGSKSLVHETQEDIGYKGSLMLFVNDLGLTAHKVAKNKLRMQTSSSSRRPRMNGWDHSSTLNCQAPSALSPVHIEPDNFLICGTIPTTSPASHHLVDIARAHDIPKPSVVSKSGENTVKSIFDTKSVNTFTCLQGTSGYALRDQVQGNMKNRKNMAVIAHTGCELTAPTMLLKDSSMLSYHGNTMPPAGRETKSKFFQAGNNFDLNHVQATLSSSNLIRCSYKDENSKTHEMTPSSGLVGATCLTPAGHATTAVHQVMKNMQPSSASNQFIFNLPYLKSRLRGLSDDVDDNSTSSSSNRQPAALQLPPEANGSQNDGFYLDDHHYTMLPMTHP